ncbi:MAG: hypothetical protein B7C24_18245 [Bacteroidetes bacterium 4572_77]|nr:MAG: hypothetical protein B7C24_18245 [Bacteroidetes bacterium 4572_77]
MKKDSKIWIIFKHEYKTKIRSKGFILSTILMPTGMLLIFGISFLVTFLSMDDTSKKIAVCDDSNFCYRALIERDKDLYYISEDSFETLKIQVQDQKIDGVLHIDSDFLENGESEIITGAGSGVGLINSIDNDLSRILRQKRLETYVSDPEIIKLLSSGVSLNKSKINKEGSAQKDNSELMAIIGYVFGLMLYMMMLLYGSMVMQSCMEEKANRIIEIIASSAKPMEIMLSKITAIGALGLTQLSIWVGSGLLLFNAFPALMSNSGDSAKMAAGLEQELGISLTSLPSIPIGSIVGLVFFFIAGYFIYATLFAAVGSAVDQEQDARQLTAPIIMITGTQPKFKDLIRWIKLAK